jgi:hypothetical protein
MPYMWHGSKLPSALFQHGGLQAGDSVVVVRLVAIALSDQQPLHFSLGPLKALSHTHACHAPAPPQRALEVGEWHRATDEKLRLEEKQRQVG